MASWMIVFLYQPVVFRVYDSLPGCRTNPIPSSNTLHISFTPSPPPFHHVSPALLQLPPAPASKYPPPPPLWGPSIRCVLLVSAPAPPGRSGRSFGAGARGRSGSWATGTTGWKLQGLEDSWTCFSVSPRSFHVFRNLIGTLNPSHRSKVLGCLMHGVIPPMPGHRSAKSRLWCLFSTHQGCQQLIGRWPRVKHRSHNENEAVQSWNMVGIGIAVDNGRSLLHHVFIK